MIDELLEYNRAFVGKKGYEKYLTNKYPDKKIAIVTCMDTRLVELIPAALGLKNGDVKMIKNAGGTITHPFGSVMRSLLVGIYELGVEEVMIIGHTDCGAQHMDSKVMLRHIKEHGVTGFDNVEQSVRGSVHLVKHHPLVPKDVTVRGFIIDSQTGELTEFKNID